MPCNERPSGESNHWLSCCRFMEQESRSLIDVLPAASQTGCMSDVLHVRAFEDNYIWLIRGKSQGHVPIVDPGDADPVLAALEKQRLKPAAILCTHHHGDHVGGVEDLLKHYSIPVYGPARERIPTLTHRLKDGDHINIAELGLEFDVLDVPGHTAGHIAFVCGGLLFCAGTLFAARRRAGQCRHPRLPRAGARAAETKSSHPALHHRPGAAHKPIFAYRTGPGTPGGGKTGGSCPGFRGGGVRGGRPVG